MVELLSTFSHAESCLVPENRGWCLKPLGKFHMKKSLIALAVLAASGAAMAQSSVTVYGIADIWFGSTKNGLGASSVTKLESGGVSGSRWGLKGTEDLGGGLKANFLLEQGFALDTGTEPDGSGFNRQAYVGLSGGFGEVRMGKVFTAYDDISGATHSAFDSALSPTVNVFESTGYTSNPSNGLYYASPAFGGFAAAASYSLKEGVNTGVRAFNVTYNGGPIYAGVAYQVQSPAAGGNSDKYTRINGSYDFGAVKLLASYGKEKLAAGDDTNEYQIGADVPLSGALTLSGGYATSKTKNAGVTQSKRSGYGVALAYSLSKRTTVYTGIQSATAKNGAGVKTDKDSTYAVGLKHTF